MTAHAVGTTEFEVSSPVFSELPPFPAVALQLLRIVNQAETSSAELVATLRTDVVLAAEVLRRANSAFYGLRSAVESLQRAVTLLGVDEIRKIALGVSIGGHFRYAPPLVRRLWRQGVARALTAERIAIESGWPRDAVYTAALLADLGFYGFLVNFDLGASIEQVEDVGGLLLLEEESLGITHPVAGAWLAQQWQFPLEVAEAVGAHHEAPLDGGLSLAAHVHWADEAVLCAGFGMLGPAPDTVNAGRYRELLLSRPLIERALPGEALDLAGWIVAQLP